MARVLVKRRTVFQLHKGTILEVPEAEARTLLAQSAEIFELLAAAPAPAKKAAKSRPETATAPAARPR